MIGISMTTKFKVVCGAQLAHCVLIRCKLIITGLTESFTGPPERKVFVYEVPDTYCTFILTNCVVIFWPIDHIVLMQLQKYVLLRKT